MMTMVIYMGLNKWIGVESVTPVYFSWTPIFVVWCVPDVINSNINAIAGYEQEK